MLFNFPICIPKIIHIDIKIASTSLWCFHHNKGGYMTKDKEYQAALEMLETLTRLLGDDVQMVPLDESSESNNATLH